MTEVIANKKLLPLPWIRLESKMDGGKSPVIVDKEAKIDVAAKRYDRKTQRDAKMHRWEGL